MFRKLILLEVLLMILAMVGLIIDAHYYQYLYPESLQLYWDTLGDTPMTAVDNMVGLASVIFGIWALQNLVALYRFKAYAPKHLAIITILGFLIIPLATPLAPVVSILLWETLFDLCIFLNGFVLALVFFSDVSKEFKN